MLTDKELENQFTDWDSFENSIIALYITTEAVLHFTFHLHKSTEEITFICKDNTDTLTFKTTDKSLLYNFFNLDHSLRDTSRYSVTILLGH